MKVKEIMNPHPLHCTPDTSLKEAAQFMVKCDCGALPVVADASSKRPIVGMITDRDIVCRTIAEGKNPLEQKVGDCMSSSIVTVNSEDTVDHCCDVMERLQIRRVPVADGQGTLMGIVTQSHIAKHLSESKLGEVVKNISQKTGVPSRVSVAAR